MSNQTSNKTKTKTANASTPPPGLAELSLLRAKLVALETEFDPLSNSPQQPQQQPESDARSVYVGNVDYGSTAEELEAHFAASCGAVCRLTILCNRYTGQPKGFAYIEFAEADSAVAALALDESQFRRRNIRVEPKRPNLPGYDGGSVGADCGSRHQPYWYY